MSKTTSNKKVLLQPVPMDYGRDVPEADENDSLQDVAEMPGSGKLLPMEQSDIFKGATQWSKMGDYIIPAANTFKKLEPGYYAIGFSQTQGMFFEKQTVQLNKLYRLPNAATDLVMNDISKFWTLEKQYEKYQRIFRRNYLLYSAPGTGKTSLINLMCQELIEKYQGIVFSLQTTQQLEAFPDAVVRIHKIEPDRRIIAIIEDIDVFVTGPNYTNSVLLNILDGNLKSGKVVVIATTNHIELLEERYVNRPSRFDRVVEFPLPNAESRKMFIEKTILPEDIEKIDIDKWVNKTEGFTIDHINELILLYFVIGYSEDESFETVTKMKEARGLKNTESVANKNVIGFN